MLTADAEELVAGAGEHGDAEVAARAERAERVGHLQGGLHAELVAGLGPVDRDAHGRAVEVEEEVLVGPEGAAVGAHCAPPTTRPAPEDSPRCPASTSSRTSGGAAKRRSRVAA